MSAVIEGFAESLRALLDAPTLERVERVWQRDRIEESGWVALATVERSTNPTVVQTQKKWSVTRLVMIFPASSRRRDARAMRRESPPGR